MLLSNDPEVSLSSFDEVRKLFVLFLFVLDVVADDLSDLERGR